MRRSAVLLVMLFAMLWHSVAMARIGSTVNVLADLEHATLHWLEEAHHHHEDGSYHQDDSKESVQHMVTDHLNASLALAGATSPDVPSLRSAAPDGMREQCVPSPALGCLFRPPRLRPSPAFTAQVSGGRLPMDARPAAPAPHARDLPPLA